eukprot:scaffold229512_cov30-Tisochrysis_lutea.AAC.1
MPLPPSTSPSTAPPALPPVSVSPRPPALVAPASPPLPQPPSVVNPPPAVIPSVLPSPTSPPPSPPPPVSPLPPAVESSPSPLASPPPSPALNPPPFPDGVPIVTLVSATADGNIEDIADPDEVVRKACSKVPGNGGDCTGYIDSGSVVIVLLIVSSDADAATSLRNALQLLLDSVDASKAFFELPINSLPVIVASVASPPSPSLPPPPGDDGGFALGVIIGIAVGGGVALCTAALACRGTKPHVRAQRLLRGGRRVRNAYFCRTTVRPARGAGLALGQSGPFDTTYRRDLRSPRPSRRLAHHFICTASRIGTPGGSGDALPSQAFWKMGATCCGRDFEGGLCLCLARRAARRVDWPGTRKGPRRLKGCGGARFRALEQPERQGLGRLR